MGGIEWSDRQMRFQKCVHIGLRLCAIAAPIACVCWGWIAHAAEVADLDLCAKYIDAHC
jgi:hypothetical protein